MSNDNHSTHMDLLAKEAAAGHDRDAALATNLRRARLDLLPVLHVLLRTGSVTKTARGLGLTQSAVSQSLRLLRQTFDDNLLVQVGRTLQPTELALNLLEPLSHWLEDAQDILSPRATFDPNKEALRVVIATADYTSMVLAPRLVAACASNASNITIQFTEHSTGLEIEDLATIDFLIIPSAYDTALGKRVGSFRMWDDEIVCVAAKSNGIIGDRISESDLPNIRQAAYRVHPSIPQKQRLLLHPKVLLGVPAICVAPDFAVLAAVVEQSDAVAFVPRLAAKVFMASGKLRIVELAATTSSFEVKAYWSLATAGRRGHAWFRKILAQTAQDIREER